jgi:hypothetical protein
MLNVGLTAIAVASLLALALAWALVKNARSGGGR